MGVIPIVNENDTIAVQEIKFGDNDTLSAITSGMVNADYLFLLTDVDCLYTENPRKSSKAKRIRVVRDIESLRKVVSTATLGSDLGTGGMETKLIAAELATAAGVATIITHGATPKNILEIVEASDELLTLPSLNSNGLGEEEKEVDLAASTELIPQFGESSKALPLHTLFLPKHTPLPDRRWWVLHGLSPRGRIVIDQGAYRAIFKSSKVSPNSQDSAPNSDFVGNGGRLLAAGVVAVEGTFAAGQAVRVAVRRKIGQVAEGATTPFSSSRPSTPLSTSKTFGDLSSIPLVKSASQAFDATQASQSEMEIVEIGRGLANYNWQEMDRIKGLKSSEIEHVLGYIDSEHVVDSITTINGSQMGV